ncbi:NADPH:quinone reductase [Curtobacterium sp. MCJR17_055]|uniref:NADPH:quinone reductase n=1 Tax=unclassified Curtobacterium TaxID=257496 RepID=UPI000D8FA808|nr:MULTISPECIES: NADPH:quinone reductase [unclassified Curtobacterium]PYY32091.1 NADPH:quinone reductase [Curtobacterium sp. MCBD17_029]PYY44241.1 NADPH:quinone reductase [Curtobacterium sp. MCBD17_023]PYY54075.1 NADPH:quinone reductase [Curtobacterium sp. MCJR17_055]PYY55950.1 NADPH:quinone reductase [Curtobacterium sp. MCPF17_015]WIB34713.1 NADPH:quinone reductase [Curtobacterium sp. MCJR17_043]
MRSIVYSQPGTSAVLSLADRPVPEPGAGEVRVRVVVSGVNPTDWKARQGGTYGDGLPFPEITPNQDGAGVVDAVGDGVEGLSVGDRVWLFMAAASRPTGTAQEFTVVPAARVVPLPEGVSFDVGASLGVPAMTAHRALTVHEDGPTRLSPGALSGKTVLVAGGAGAVGHAAIQLASWAGATVVATVSSEDKAALATAAGAHHTVNYREDGAADRIRSIAPDGVDIVVEVSIPANADLDAAVLANHGVVSMYADNGGDAASIPVRPNMGINARYQFLLLYTIGDAALAAAAEDITAALRDGVLPVGEEAGLALIRFPLEETAAAHDAVQGDAVGKVLIDVQSAE